MKFKEFLLVLLLVGLMGCGSTGMNTTVNNANKIAASDGSPYRWEHKSVNGGEVLTKVLIGVPAPTSADAELESFTRKKISLASKEIQISEDQNPVEIRLVSASDSHVQEVWVYEVSEKRVAFLVTFQPSKAGGTDINISGPW